MNLSDSVKETLRLNDLQKKALEKIGIKTVKDLLFYFPLRYGDTADIKNISSLSHGENVVIFGKIENLKTKKGFRTKIPMGVSGLILVFLTLLSGGCATQAQSPTSLTTPCVVPLNLTMDCEEPKCEGLTNEYLYNWGIRQQESLRVCNTRLSELRAYIQKQCGNNGEGDSK
jgi:hypothetical protein